MDAFEISHFSHRALLLDLRTSRGTECKSTAVVLSRIGEVDTRELYLQEGYASMYTFLVQDLHYSEGAAYKRLYAARAARKFPLLYVAVAEGKLHLSGVVMLSRYLTEGNVGQLVDAATHKTKAEIAQLIANRFPRPDLPERLQVIAPPAAVTETTQPSPGTVDGAGSWLATAPHAPADQLSPGKVPSTDSPARGSTFELSRAKDGPPAPPSRMTPLAPQRFAFQFTGDQETHELYEDVRALLGHEVPGGEMALVFKSALKLAKVHLAKRKFAATDRPGTAHGSADPRHIPAVVKRAVCERDGRQCTFVSKSGKRCASRSMLEYDHIESVACGGTSTVENIRLLCRPHNQHEAERTFGAEFMERKRAAARSAPTSAPRASS